MKVEGTELTIPEFKRKGKGRPSKTEIEAKLKPGTVGRPKGDAGRMAEIRARILATSGFKVVDETIRIALNPEHPNQMAALALLMARIAPVSGFEKDGNAKGTININITTDNGNVSVQADPAKVADAQNRLNVVDAEFKELSRG